MKLPSNWSIKTISDVCLTSSGSTPNRSVSEYYTKNGMPWVKSGELKEGIITAAEEFVTEKAIVDYRLKKIPKGTFIVAMYGANVGRSAMLGIEAVTNQAVCSIRPKDKGVSTEYLKFFFQMIKDDLISKSFGGAQPNISQKIINSLEIPVPPEQTQQRIVLKLQSAFNKLEQAKQELIVAEKQISTIFTSSLHRFIHKADTPYNWKRMKLKDICLLRRGPFGGSITKSMFEPEGYKVYEQKNAIYDDLSLGRYFINDEKFNSLKVFEVKSGDILMSCSGTIGKLVIIPPKFKSGIINQALLRITPDKTFIDTYFLKLLLESDYIRNKYLLQTAGTAMQNLSPLKKIKEMELIIPPLNEQQRITKYFITTISVIDKIKKSVIVSKMNCEKIRQSLLQKAFTGELVN